MVSQFFNELKETSGSTERIREMLNEPIEESADDQKVDVAGKNCNCKMSASLMKKISKFCITLM